MKKLINDPGSFVRESVEGFVLAHADILTSPGDPLIVTRRPGAAGERREGKVGLVSGGGSGHEPLHIGFVGPGMLDVAVPGPVFTSPSPDPFLAAIRAADDGAGVVVIVKNYTGDVLNVEIAVEIAQAEGIDVRTVLVSDDVAVAGSTYTTGRRGVAGTVLVEKIAGALAETGADLDAVTAVATEVAARVRTMGVALHAPTLPQSGRTSFDLADDEIEIGIGIHGEPGRRRAAHAGADEITGTLLDAVLTDLGDDLGSRALLFVNGMGATPDAELYVAYRHAARMLAERGVTVSRSLVGGYVTSLDMAGMSLTLLPLDARLTELWDAPVRTAALRWRA